MRFLLMFLMDPSVMPDPELSNKCFGEMMSFVEQLKESNQLLFDSQVLPEPPPARLTMLDGSLTVSEPKGEAVLGGFFVVDAKSHAEALALARRCPHHQVGPIELRALNETDENAYS